MANAKSVRIVMTNGQQVVYRYTSQEEREKVEKAISTGEAVRVEEGGRTLILNPAHIVTVVDLRPDEVEADEAPPSQKGDLCGVCRGRGTIVRIENRIKTERTCTHCHGAGLEP